MLNNSHAPGKHVLLDFWGAKKITDLDFVQKTLIEVATECKATILDTKMHSFGEGVGITGVIILAESHISIHTWPEIDFCAIDVFMCGECDAVNAIEPLKRLFNPDKVIVQQYRRG
ncbi:MAG: adenosylmethionine decarboxylase [Rickettsiales bacterium]|nr:adenosylmethionine decarboxylase [Rickettsiales bacterium]